MGLSAALRIRGKAILLLLLGLLPLLLILSRALPVAFAGREGASPRVPRSEGLSLTSRFEPYLSPPPPTQPSPFIAGRSMRLGLQIENLYEPSLSNRNFKANGWFWLKWSEPINRLLMEHSLEVEDLIHFQNLVDDDSLTINTTGKPTIRSPENDYYRRFHFSGSFYITQLEMATFPMHRLELPIVFELAPISLACHDPPSSECVALTLDSASKGSRLGDFADLNGYSLKGIRVEEVALRHSVNYGIDQSVTSGAIVATVIYTTNFSDAFWQHVFPVLVLTVMAILSLSLPGSLGDIRIAIPSTLLLTLIFLQIGYRNELPPLAYTTYLDWLYIYAYSLSLLLFAVFCWGANYYTKSLLRSGEEQALRRINRLDFILQLAATSGLLAFLLYGLLLSLRI
jgi:hypothetical protein